MAGFGLGVIGLVVIGLLVCLARDLGYKRGFEDGVQHANDVWNGIEGDVDQERMKMWREYERKENWP